MTHKQKALESMRDVIWRKHYSIETARTYLLWFGKFWDYALTLPRELSREKKLEAYLTAEAKRGCAAATQDQAFNAICFYFKEVLCEPLDNVKALRVKRPPVLRVAPSREETIALLGEVRDVGGYPTRLIARLLYGCGLRVSEPLNLRIKDVDLEGSRLMLWETKGGQCRVVKLPCAVSEDLRAQIKLARAVWEQDVRAGLPVAMPGRLAEKARGNAFAWGWAWVFPAHGTCRHPRTGETVRWRCHECNVQRAVKAAAAKVGLGGLITPHNLRHAYATHVMDAGGNVRDLQSAMGHKSLETTQIYAHSDGLRVVSPLDAAGAAGSSKFKEQRSDWRMQGAE
jgi:integrase